MDERGPSRAARSRAERVLAPEFVEGLEQLPLDEIRRRRDEALAEREFQSYLRRLVQVRQDVLSAEQQRRAQGLGPQPMVERLTEALSEGRPKGASRGEAIRFTVSDADLGEAERRAGELIGDAGMGDPTALDEDRLTEALAALQNAERAISDDRSAVLRVHDRLQEELKRRYRDDPSLALR